MSSLGKYLLKQTSASTSHPVAAVLGKAIMGAVASRLNSKKGTDMNKHLMAHMKKHLKGHDLVEKVMKVTPQHVKDVLTKHKEIQIHVSDVFGEKWGEHVKKIRDLTGGQDGGSWKSIKSKLKSFLSGKTKLKPHHLLDAASGLVTAAGAASAVIPGVDIISVPAAASASAAIKTASTALKKSGRGMAEPSGAGLHPPGGKGLNPTGGSLNPAGSSCKYKHRGGKIVGTYKEVYDPNLPHEVTRGGLTKNDLMKNKRGKVVSKRRSEASSQRGFGARAKV